MTDRELLELAAKAAGLSNYEYQSPGGMRELAVHGVPHCGFQGDHWNPLTSDGDALRLAMELDLNIVFYRKHVDVYADARGIEQLIREYFTAHHKPDATRRCIVRAAAEIGRERIDAAKIKQEKV